MVVNLSSLADPVQPDRMSSYLDVFHLQVTGFGSWQRNRERRISNFIVSQYELSYLARGELLVVAKGREYLCTGGTLFLFEPFVPYSVEKRFEGDMDLYNLFFDFAMEYRQTEFLERILPPDRPLWYGAELPEVGTLFHDVFTLCQSSSQGKRVMVDCLLRLCLIYMMRARREYGALPTAGAGEKLTHLHQVIRQAVGYIQAHVGENFKLYQLCKEIGVSESYLYKCFHTMVHMSPQQYIQQYKMKQAVQMLRFEGRSVGETAAALGFSSAYHLSNAFKKVLGCAPTHYLKEADFLV